MRVPEVGPDLVRLKRVPEGGCFGNGTLRELRDAVAVGRVSLQNAVPVDGGGGAWDAVFEINHHHVTLANLENNGS
jgi:hypothetical protein